ncbi:Pkinase-domain-containing protein [Annulohypoxylon maeteangense]|uniref:Pkinase-domain-containing protein n=1 Tax=Annulohypoxylon maeteangense TaxID=1927788 RepID=UPI0020082366|nr:Pkinase-domain-containing protein [Annulohypoxylon maeteangense]KAI0887275.1 Pkinase-domain-containing protein [Annulohypoxylon maeteangense]
MATDPTVHLQGDENTNQDGDPEPQRGRGSTRSNKLSAPLRLPKNRSTGNLAVVGEFPERPRLRFSFDTGSGVAESDQITRSPIITEHDHGLGISGLRRIRQHPTPRIPTMPSTAVSSRSPSTGLARSTSMTMMLPSGQQTPLTPGPASPNFSEDLSRFPSESLHSFSFAHQSEEFIHNRQNVLKRSIEFMKDRMGWSMSSNAAGIASAQARVSGDVETQHMLDLLARAQLVGAGNLPNADSSIPPGPLTGPARVSIDNVFEKDFIPIPRTSSPESFVTPMVSPTDTQKPPVNQFSLTTTKPTGSEEDRPMPKQVDVIQDQTDSESSSRTPTNESGTTAQTSPPVSRRPSLRRTYTDVVSAEMQQKLMDTMAQPFLAASSERYTEALVSPTLPPLAMGSALTPSLGPSVHGHATRWVPAAQAIFTTESKPPWTILAANDLACLVFGVTKAEVRKMGILEVVQEERRSWLENRLLRADPNDVSQEPAETAPPPIPSAGSSLLGGRGGITAHLLSKPNSRSQRPKAPARRAQTVHSGDTTPSKPRGVNHRNSKSRGVLLCGDVVPIQKRNGATGSASLWVKEKKVGLIWVLEEIHEDVALVSLDEDGVVTKILGDTGPIWGEENLRPGMDVGKLIPRIPRQGIDPRYGAIDYAQIAKRKYFTCRNGNKVNVPTIVSQTRGQPELRISSFPHIAGIIVVSPDTLKITSSNSAFCGALFGYEKPEGQSICNLIPDFDKILEILVDHDGVQVRDGIVVPEHSFRKASVLLALHDSRPDAAASFLNSDGLPAKHRDGTELKIDVQMRIVKSEKKSGNDSSSSDDESQTSEGVLMEVESEVVYALWITYSRHLHASVIKSSVTPKSPVLSGAVSPLHQPSPGQTPAHTPQDIGSDSEETKSRPSSTASALSQQLKVVAMNAAAKLTGVSRQTDKSPPVTAVSPAEAPARKKTIDDFVILEDMGQGAYGQVKLARYKYGGGKKVVLKYVTKRRILVDTWTRDRRLGTVPLEIHVLDYLRRDGFKHPNIVEMEDFFEDEVNYYIEMAPHGYPGMDLFDYIELRTNMEEDECRSIFVQVARAIHHLHTRAKVVHRDIKDENVILDGEGNIKLIDFGSAAYIKSGPFDVFVGTIDYAAPEVLAGKPYGGKEQDVWALGILLYTIIYKENPFYSIDEIMDRDLRVPYVISDESIDLIRCMLDRDVSQRYDIEQVIQHPWCQTE